MATKQYAKEPTRDGEAIIRQSQLQRAIELFQLFQVKPTLREVLRLSQVLTDFQYTWELNHYEILNFEQHFKQNASPALMNSTPHQVTSPAQEEKKTKTVSEYQTSVAKQLKGKV